MSIHLNALHRTAAAGDAAPTSAAIWMSDPSASQRAVAFASLVDLARIQFGASTVEICDACNTVNLGAANFCKGCAHKLPAYYAACEGDPELACPHEAALPRARAFGLPGRAAFPDFAAFALVVNLLVMVAEFMPFQ